MHFGAVGFNGGSQAGVGHIQCTHRNVHRLRQIHTAKHDARVGRSWTQRQFNALPAVQSDTNGAGDGLDGSLFEHLLILIRLLAQERRDLVIVHAARRQSIYFGGRLGAIGTPHAGNIHVDICGW